MIKPPYQLASLVKLAGEQAVLRLVEGHGGQRLWVPLKTEGSLLERLYGNTIARALSEEHGGEKMKVPLARAWRAGCYRRGGLTIDQIARQLGVDRSTIVRLLKQNGDATPPAANRDDGTRSGRRQMDMFPAD